MTRRKQRAALLPMPTADRPFGINQTEICVDPVGNLLIQIDPANAGFVLNAANKQLHDGCFESRRFSTWLILGVTRKRVYVSFFEKLKRIVP